MDMPSLGELSVQDIQQYIDRLVQEAYDLGRFEGYYEGLSEGRQHAA